MLLSARRWGPSGPADVVCVHGLTQHGGVFAQLGERLAGEGRRVVAVDLRGHGDSGREPPWDVAAHVGDLLETLDAGGIGRAAWVGHSFGAHVLAAAAATAPDRVSHLALLDPAFEATPEYALRSAEADRLDWSFASVDSAVNTLLASDTVVAVPRETVASYAADALRPGPDGRLRFDFSPAAAVVAWSEMSRPAPGIARVPTLLVRPLTSPFASRAQDRRYRDELGSLLRMEVVPNGHNVLWESPAETSAAVSGFLRE